MQDLIGEDRGGDPQDDERHTECDLAGKCDHVLVIAAYIRVGTDGDRGHKGGSDVGQRVPPVRSLDADDGVPIVLHAIRGALAHGRAARHVTLHQVIERALEDLAHFDELIHLRVGLLGLPLGDGLAGYPKQHGELLLGHVALGAQILKVGTEAHSRSSRWLEAGTRAS